MFARHFSILPPGSFCEQVALLLEWNQSKLQVEPDWNTLGFPKTEWGLLRFLTPYITLNRIPQFMCVSLWVHQWPGQPFHYSHIWGSLSALRAFVRSGHDGHILDNSSCVSISFNQTCFHPKIPGADVIPPPYWSRLISKSVSDVGIPTVNALFSYFLFAE